MSGGHEDRGVSRRAWLRRMVPGADDRPRFDLRLDRARCIATLGIECGACAELCPPEAAGALLLRARVPELDSARCTGCLACVRACPVSPSALTLRTADGTVLYAAYGSDDADDVGEERER